jgi:hypothetical protein
MVSFDQFPATGGSFLIGDALVAGILPDGVLVDELLVVRFDALVASAGLFAFERVRPDLDYRISANLAHQFWGLLVVQKGEKDHSDC